MTAVKRKGVEEQECKLRGKQQTTGKTVGVRKGGNKGKDRTGKTVIEGLDSTTTQIFFFF